MEATRGSTRCQFFLSFRAPRPTETVLPSTPSIKHEISTFSWLPCFGNKFATDILSEIATVLIFKGIAILPSPCVYVKENAGKRGFEEVQPFFDRVLEETPKRKLFISYFS